MVQTTIPGLRNSASLYSIPTPAKLSTDCVSENHTWIAAAGVLGVVAIAGWASYFSRPATAPARELRLSVLPPPGTSLLRVGSQLPPTLSPDGLQLLLRTSEGAVVRPLDSTELVPLGSITHYAFSPDGPWIVRTGSSFQLEKRRLPDGPWQRLKLVSGAARGLAWGSRGWILVGGVATEGPLWAASEDGGESVRALDDSWEAVRWPQFLPDGERFIFSGARPEKMSKVSTWRGSERTGVRRSRFSS